MWKAEGQVLYCDIESTNSKPLTSNSIAPSEYSMPVTSDFSSKSTSHSVESKREGQYLFSRSTAFLNFQRYSRSLQYC
jgi:hypothetical protein